MAERESPFFPVCSMSVCEREGERQRNEKEEKAERKRESKKVVAECVLMK